MFQMQDFWWILVGQARWFWLTYDNAYTVAGRPAMAQPERRRWNALTLSAISQPH